jgi:hypothetical protein
VNPSVEKLLAQKNRRFSTNRVTLLHKEGATVWSNVSIRSSIWVADGVLPPGGGESGSSAGFDEPDVDTIVQRALEKHPGAMPRIISDNGPQCRNCAQHDATVRPLCKIPPDSRSR